MTIVFTVQSEGSAISKEVLGIIRKRNESSIWDEEADVVVAGAGDAGLSAAIESTSAGAKTVVFEKMGTIQASSSARSERVGGSGMGGSNIAFAGTDFQQQQGIQDSESLFFKDLMEAGQCKNDQKLVKAFVKKQLETYYWLTALGVKWSKLVVSGGMSVPRGHLTTPAGHVNSLKEEAVNRGVRIVFRARVTELISDEEKRVIGVSVEQDRGSLRVRARRGVVLATGGFGHDARRLEAINPRLVNVAVITGVGNTGDGLRMTEAVGACFAHMTPEYIRPSFGIHATGVSLATLSHLWWSGPILVNKEGKRFVNESLELKSIGIASLDQPDGTGYQIFDHKIFEKAQEGPPPFGLNEKMIKLVVSSETIEDLAVKLEMPRKTLRATIDRYNNGVYKGKDPDFGRTTLVWNFGQPVRIEVPPFYAYAIKAFLPATYGGIAVDADMHVLTAHGKILGLYAAGEVVGGFHGVGVMGGSAIAKALVFGRIAGINCANEQ